MLISIFEFIELLYKSSARKYPRFKSFNSPLISVSINLSETFITPSKLAFPASPFIEKLLILDLMLKLSLALKKPVDLKSAFKVISMLLYFSCENRWFNSEIFE